MGAAGAQGLQTAGRTVGRVAGWGAVGAITLAALATMRAHLQDLYLTPESGLGYALGVVGLSMMVLLLGYSLRKRVGFFGRFGPIRPWFHVHMALGVLGPIAILAHARFALGSLNGAVATVCMLAVAGSGIVGRFIYTRVHYGFSDRRRELSAMKQAASSSRSRLIELAGSSRAVERRLAELEEVALAPSDGLVEAVVRRAAVGRRSRRVRRAVRTGAASGRARRSAIRQSLRDYLGAARAAANLSVYERLFSLWHVLHLPLCFLLFVSAAVHVLAVHAY